MVGRAKAVRVIAVLHVPCSNTSMGNISIKSKVVGVTATNPDGSNRQVIIASHCRPGMPLVAKPEPANPYDSDAIGVWVEVGAGKLAQIGYVGSGLAGEIAPQLRRRGQNKCRIAVTILDVTGGTADKSSRGVNIEIELIPAPVETRPRTMESAEQVAPSKTVLRPTPEIDPSAPLVFAPTVAERLSAGYHALPEWVQPIVWGLGIAGVVGALAGLGWLAMGR